MPLLQRNDTEPMLAMASAPVAIGWEVIESLMSMDPVVPVIQDEGDLHQCKHEQGGWIINDTAIDLVAIHVPMTNPAEAQLGCERTLSLIHGDVHYSVSIEMEDRTLITCKPMWP